MKKRLGCLAFCLVSMLVIGSDGLFTTSQAGACQFPLPPHQCRVDQDCLWMSCAEGAACRLPTPCQRVCVCLL